MLSTIYSKELHKNLKPFFANWEPDFLIEIGDYGYLNNDIFQKTGNVLTDFKKDLLKENIQLNKKQGSGEATKSFKSHHSIQVSLHGKGELGNIGNAAMKVSFGNSNSIFFNASGCYYESLSNFVEVGDFLIDRYANKLWKKDFYVVTDIMKADSTLVLINNKSAGEIILESKISEINELSLSDTSLDLKICSNNCVGYSIETKKGLIPMFRLAKIKDNLFIEPKFKPVFKGLSDEESEDSNKKREINFERIE